MLLVSNCFLQTDRQDPESDESGVPELLEEVADISKKVQPTPGT